MRDGIGRDQISGVGADHPERRRDVVDPAKPVAPATRRLASRLSNRRGQRGVAGRSRRAIQREPIVTPLPLATKATHELGQLAGVVVAGGVEGHDEVGRRVPASACSNASR